MAARREKGFYSTVSSVSSVDILPSFGRKIGRITRGQFYEVDRLINKRGKGNETEYLVKWKGYSPYESTREPKENISTDCLRYFENPRPPVDVVFEEVSRLQAAIDRRLKSKSRLPVTVAFRTDVFKFLFQGKGRVLNNWVLLEGRDFTQTYFPVGWDVCLDSHGQGTRIYFPLKIRQFYTMSPKKYTRGTSGYNVATRAYEEKITFMLRKRATGE